MKSQLFEKIIKIGTLSKINQKKREKTQVNNSRDEKRVLTTDINEIRKNVRIPLKYVFC